MTSISRASTFSALILVVLTQYTFDAKGRRYQCAPYDWNCTVLPPPGAPLQPLPDQRRQPPTPPKVDDCGSRCDLLDRMK